MPKPPGECWMTTRSCDVNANPGAIDISMEETVDNLPKTPTLRKKRARNKKEIKSAEEVEVGIQHVAAYERQSLNEELVKATPQTMITPAPPHQLSEPSEQDEGGNVTDNVSYHPPSGSIPDELTSGAEVGSILLPVGNLGGQRADTKKKGKKGKKVVVLQINGSVTKSNSEPTPFKMVMSEQGKRFGKDIGVDTVEEPTPTKAMAASKGKGKVCAASYLSMMESDSQPKECWCCG